MRDSERASLVRRGRLQLALTAVFGVLTILALAIPMWIEELTGVSPDGGNGEFELLMAVPFGIASLVLAMLTWRTRQRLQLESHTG